MHGGYGASQVRTVDNPQVDAFKGFGDRLGVLDPLGVERRVIPAAHEALSVHGRLAVAHQVDALGGVLVRLAHHVKRHGCVPA